MEEEKQQNAPEPEEQKPSSAPAAEGKPEEPKAREGKKEEAPESVAEEKKEPASAPASAGKEEKEEAPEEKAEAPEEKKKEEETPKETEEPAVEEVKEEEKEKEEEEVKEEAPAPEEKPSSAAAAEGEPAAKVDKRWYVIQTLTGQEDKVKQAIERTIESKKLADKLFQVLVPTEEMVEIKGGKRIEKVRKMFPGYVFLEMVLDDESWFTIRNTPWVARFIGTKTRPTPVSDREMQRVLKQLGKEERLEVTFEKGEGVRVISGPFRGYTGTVDEVNIDKGKLKVLINIFGRDTPVEVNFEHAQKIV